MELPVERRTRGLTLLAALAGSLPSLLSGAWRPGLLVDDWSHAYLARAWGWWGFHSELVSRPLEGFYNWLTFTAIGPHPVPLLLLLALLNGVAAALVWRLARSWLPTRLALLVTGCWVALPNRGSMSMWIANGPHVLALVLLLGGLLLVARKAPPTPVQAIAGAALVVAANLGYDGAIALSAVGLVLTTRALPRRRRVPAAALLLAALAGLATWIRAASPKSHAAHPGGLDRLVGVHFGAGVLPDALVRIGPLVAIAAVLVAVLALLPGFRARVGDEGRVVAVGVAVLLLGAAPFLVIGFPLATDGVFDRGNLFADLGTALVWGGLLGLLWRCRQPVLAGITATVVVAILAAGLTTDLRAYHDAAADGRATLLAVDRLPKATRMRGPLVLDPLPNRNGVAMFVEGYDISAALALRYHTGRREPRARVRAAW